MEEHPGEDLSLYERQWEETWTSFNRAIRSPDDFNAFLWIFRLAKSFIVYLYFRTGLIALGIHKKWRSAIPVFALLLIFLVVLSYFAQLRYITVRTWCPVESGIDPPTCRSAFLHDSFVLYIGTMIVFHYLSASLKSPGVALAAEFDELGNEDTVPGHLQWKSVDCKGGCCCLNPTLSVVVERCMCTFDTRSRQACLRSRWRRRAAPRPTAPGATRRVRSQAPRSRRPG